MLPLLIGGGLALGSLGMDAWASAKAEKERKRRDRAMEELKKQYAARAYGRGSERLGDLSTSIENAGKSIGQESAISQEAKSTASRLNEGAGAGLDEAGAASFGRESAATPDSMSVFTAGQNLANPSVALGNNLLQSSVLQRLLAMKEREDELATARAASEIQNKPWSNSIRNLGILSKLLGVGSQAAFAANAAGGASGGATDSVKYAGYGPLVSPSQAAQAAANAANSSTWFDTMMAGGKI
jgi:hypothetical protein